MAEDIEEIAMDAEESAAIEDVEADALNDEPAGQIEKFIRDEGIDDGLRDGAM